MLNGRKLAKSLDHSVFRALAALGMVGEIQKPCIRGPGSQLSDRVFRLGRQSWKPHQGAKERARRIRQGC